MTEHPLELIRGPDRRPQVKPRHPLGDLDSNIFSKHLVVFRPDEKGLDGLVEKARASIPGLTDTAVVRGVWQHNQDSIWAIARKRKFKADAPAGDGFIAFLFLNKAGLHQLATNTLDTHRPDIRLLAGPNERPAGIYIWATYAPGVLAGAVAPVLREVEAPNYAGVDLYTFPRAPQTPLYDSYRKSSGTRAVTVTVARTFEDLVRVASLRSAVYIG